MPNLIGSPCVLVAMTSCTSSATARVSTVSASRLHLLLGRARGASIGRPKALMPDQRKEALQRLESGESRAAVARSYGLSKATVYRMVRSACLSGGLLEAGLVMQVTDARTASQSLTLENATKAIPAFSGILADSFAWG